MEFRVEFRPTAREVLGWNLGLQLGRYWGGV